MQIKAVKRAVEDGFVEIPTRVDGVETFHQTSMNNHRHLMESITN